MIVFTCLFFTLQQEELIGQLQDQHYEQYMQHVHSQLLLHQRQQQAQILSHSHKGHLPVSETEETTPSPSSLEFHTDDAAAYHRGDEVFPAEANGAASDLALLATSCIGGEELAQGNEEEAEESDVEDQPLTGNYFRCYITY